MTKDYLRKNVSFDMLNEEEKKLYEDLQKLPHGEFNKRTKLFWKTLMEIENKENSPENVWRKKMQDAVTRIETPWLSELNKVKEEGE